MVTKNESVVYYDYFYYHPANHQVNNIYINSPTILLKKVL